MSRERERLKKERDQHIIRVKSLLALHGIVGYEPIRRDRRARLEALRAPAGRLEDAVTAIETALRFDPNLDVGHLFELGMAYFLISRHAPISKHASCEMLSDAWASSAALNLELSRKLMGKA